MILKERFARPPPQATLPQQIFTADLGLCGAFYGRTGAAPEVYGHCGGRCVAEEDYGSLSLPTNLACHDEIVMLPSTAPEEGSRCDDGPAPKSGAGGGVAALGAATSARSDVPMSEGAPKALLRPPSSPSRAGRAVFHARAHEPYCSLGHALLHVDRRRHLCDKCESVGTDYRCSQGCDYDLCTTCYSKMANCTGCGQGGLGLKLCRDDDGRWYCSHCWFGLYGTEPPVKLRKQRPSSPVSAGPSGSQMQTALSPPRENLSLQSPALPSQKPVAATGQGVGSLATFAAMAAALPASTGAGAVGGAQGNLGGIDIYEGQWLRDGDSFPMGEIRRGQMIWSRQTGAADFGTTSLAVDGLGQLLMALHDVQHVGRLVDGRLFWSDGEIWSRGGLVGALPGLVVVAEEERQRQQPEEVEQEPEAEDDWAKWQGGRPEVSEAHGDCGNAERGQVALSWQDGRRYLGAWADGRPEGEGMLTHPSGDTYEGQWQRGLMHGEGTLRHSKGGGPGGGGQGHEATSAARLVAAPMASASVYTGQWARGLRHGFGVEEWSDGARYEGGFRRGQRHGGGAIIFPSGLIRRVL
mmetsp:Transcript_129972/g.290141  ORF Transcript_129972/g.290141 Transcript_129972/m.290141 type:complete len:580 (-) Transcript_129972:38-1777(-)